MKINNINSNYTNPQFKAKFLATDDLTKVAKWAVEHNKFDKLNQARKNIDSAYLTYRIKFELFTTPDKKPFVMFTRFIPKRDAKVLKTS